VLASHDRYLIDKLANKVVDVEAGQVVLYPGNYTNYHEKKAALEAALAAEESARKVAERQMGRDGHQGRTQNSEPRTYSARSTQHAAPRSALSPRRLRRELESVEREIISVEGRIAELERLMTEPELFADPARSAPVVAEHTELSARLPQLNQRWEDLGTQLAESEEGGVPPR
jgi:ATP-binding cassette subfamily F protein 3